MSWDSFRLARLSVASKLLVTLFLLIVGPGYLVATANIYFKNKDADGDSEMTVDDLRATFHGLEQKGADTKSVNSSMLEQVRPGGDMREYLEEDEPATNGLIAWLEAEAKEADFDTPGLKAEGDWSAKQAIATYCVDCHNSDGGDNEDVPYAATADSEPEYDLVFVSAEATVDIQEGEVKVIKPKSERRLVHITHAHILAIPVFTLLVGALFMMTGFGSVLKFLLGPLPMLAVLADISSWWLARYAEPFIYVIAAAGAVFGIAYALQILGILCSMWFGRSEDPAAEGD
jgi:hypothetical protein